MLSGSSTSRSQSDFNYYHHSSNGGSSSKPPQLSLCFYLIRKMFIRLLNHYGLLILTLLGSTVFILVYYGKRVENIVYLSVNNNINYLNPPPPPPFLSSPKDIITTNLDTNSEPINFLIPDDLSSSNMEFIDSNVEAKIKRKTYYRERGQVANRQIPTMGIIVGYIQNDQTTTAALNKSELNVNNYGPIAGEGEYGKAVNVPYNYRHLERKYWTVNQFNLMASDIISVDRNLNDVRPEGCKIVKHQIPSTVRASVIIIFHNEAWSTLIRTVRSVINRSPNHLIREILLIDDASDREFLGNSLEAYLLDMEISTIIYRMPVRSGLIASRLYGAKQAQGSILIFLDSHCECTIGWLEPLMFRLEQKRNVVVCPVIDVIKDDTFEYATGLANTWGGFNWKLQFRWYSTPRSWNRKTSTMTYETPTMAGGLFAIRKDYFFEIGTYDDKMTIWGGENLELSFRVWQCGGTIEIHGCSHVGHVFRRKSPYIFPGGILANVNKNIARTAEVWLDDYKEFLYYLSPDIKIYQNVTDVSNRLALRSALHCRSFDWYLKSVYPENYFPHEYVRFGKIINDVKSSMCLDATTNINGLHSFLSISKCTTTADGVTNIRQLFMLKKNGLIVTDENMCLDAYELMLKAVDSYKETRVVLRLCNANKHSQKWVYDVKAQTIKNVMNDLCLTSKSSPYNTEWDINMKPCIVSPNPYHNNTMAAILSNQTWIFQDIQWQHEL